MCKVSILKRGTLLWCRDVKRGSEQECVQSVRVGIPGSNGWLDESLQQGQPARVGVPGLLGGSHDAQRQAARATRRPSRRAFMLLRCVAGESQNCCVCPLLCVHVGEKRHRPDTCLTRKGRVVKPNFCKTSAATRVNIRTWTEYATNGSVRKYVIRSYFFAGACTVLDIK